MKFILILSLVVVAITAVPQKFSVNSELNEEWETYKTTFGRKYDELTDITRRLIWEQNLKYIQKHNLEYDLGKHTYSLGLNQFADMTNEEFKAKYLGIMKTKPTLEGSTYMAPENIGVLPASVDWRQKGYVTPVKNQQQCGSCWSFSATGSLEGQYFRKNNRLISFSEQQLVDCSGAYGNYGCGGGLMDNAFRYIKDQGIESEGDYPYTATDGTCKRNPSKIVTKCTGFTDIQSQNETDLANAVATVGPVSVAIDAGHASFQLYKSGIYNEESCSTTQLDHGVLAVGYGTQIGKKYWIVKNSWDVTWGESGYIKMSKDKKNQCGIATMASYPLV